MNKGRTIVVGDIHGCLIEFDELINKLSLQKEDKLILLGDLIDRGPDSVGVVRRARELGAISVMGNHEFHFIKWFRSNKKVFDHKKHYNEFSDEDIDYIHKMPYFLKLEPNFIVVHAGLKPNIDVKSQKQTDYCYLRFIDKDWNNLSLHKVMKKEYEQDIYFWTQFWNGPESVIYGHHVHDFNLPKIEEISPGIKCYGLDTGCVFGGNLTALILETQEIVQVPAKEIYYKSDFLES